MNQLPKIISTKATIRFQDCDPFNHLNNGKYIDYFVNHREDALIANYDVNIFKITKETGKTWVTGSNQIVYLKPALLMEPVYIESQLIHYTDSELLVEMRMFSEDKKHLKSVLWANFIHIELLKGKRTTHEETLMNLFKNVHLPVEAVSFNERIHQFKKVVHS